MRLSSQVVDLRWLRRVDDVHQAVAVDQVPVVEDHLPLRHCNGDDDADAGDDDDDNDADNGDDDALRGFFLLLK